MSRFDVVQPRSCRNREVSSVETGETLDTGPALQTKGAIQGVICGLFIELAISALIFCAIEIYRALHL
jgi:hypothetical protein